MTLRTGDAIVIRWRGKQVPGRIRLASDNERSLFIEWDVFKTEAMIAGCLGAMPLLRDDDTGIYRCLMNDEAIDIEQIVAVHVLHYGRPLCGFSLEVFPRDWPPGHRWVGLDELGDATCPRCIDVAGKITGATRP
jgi:hypothetical protein